MSKPTVLLVEDNMVNQVVAVKILERLGLKADIAQNGSEALEMTIHVINDKGAFAKMEEGHNFALILMDINLGGGSISGEEIMKQLKKDPRYKTIPIVAVTSYAMPGDREHFLEAGFDAYMAKPVRKADLVKQVERYLTETIG